MVLAIDIGATKTLLALYNQTGTVVRQHKFSTDTDQNSFSTHVQTEIEALLQETKSRAIAVGVAGAVTPEGIVLKCGNLPWRNYNLAKVLRQFKVPLVVDNDANLGGLAEATAGSGQGYSLVLYITIGTGVGTGIVKDGQIILPRSEGGLMVNNFSEHQRFERAFSGSSIFKRYGKYGYQIKDTGIWEEIARHMSVGVNNIISLVGPDVVVIGGGIGVHFTKFIKPLQHDLEHVYGGLWPLPPIKQAKWPETAVIEGCYLAGKRLASN